MFLVAATLAVGVAFIALSAAHHSSAVSTCEGLFSADTATSTSQKVCDIWVWVQIGVMGLLWVLITICEVSRERVAAGGGGWRCQMRALTAELGWAQIYFVVYAGIYASEQRLDQ